MGSCTDKPLTEKLREASKPTPLHPELKRLCNKRDRCAGQYQGANAFFSTQEFKHRNEDGVGVVDNSQTSCHGKSYADGASNTTTGHLRTTVKQSEPVGPGTRGLALFAADKMRQTPSKKTTHRTHSDYSLITHNTHSLLTLTLTHSDCSCIRARAYMQANAIVVPWTPSDMN